MDDTSNPRVSEWAISQVLRCGKGVYFDGKPDAPFDHTEATLLAAGIWGVLDTEGNTDCNKLVRPIGLALDNILGKKHKFFPNDERNIQQLYDSKDIHAHVDILLDMIRITPCKLDHKIGRRRFDLYGQVNFTTIYAETISQLPNWEKAKKKIKQTTAALLRQYNWCTERTQKQPYLDECSYDVYAYLDAKYKAFRESRRYFERWKDLMHTNALESGELCPTTPRLKL